MIDELEFITLTFDDGDVECQILGVFELDGKEYIALLPDDDSDDVYLYAYKELDDETFDIDDIEDDEEFEKVVAEFERIANSDEE